MMISPGYPYEKAPDQEHFLQREQTKALFREIFAPYNAGKRSGSSTPARCSSTF